MNVNFSFFISPCIAINLYYNPYTHYKDPNCLVDILLIYGISKFLARSVACIVLLIQTIWFIGCTA